MNKVEKQVAKRVHDFDFITLLRFLQYINYPPDAIRFRSHDSVSSQAGLIHDIAFKRHPLREVVITLNLGLLSAQSPLPSYFRQRMEQEEDGGYYFSRLCGYLDHHIIADYLRNIYPELNAFYFPDWETTKRQYLNILNLKSSSGLHWLFKRVFPEINVRVESVAIGSDVQAEPIRLGKTMLSPDAVFGKKTPLITNGRRLTLSTESEMTHTQVPWPREIEERLNSLIFPILRPVGVDLEIILILKSQKRWVRLHGETYLGYDRIQSNEDTYRLIRIFRGHIGEL
jgi:hypothetical protein